MTPDTIAFVLGSRTFTVVLGTLVAALADGRKKESLKASTKSRIGFFTAARVARLGQRDKLFLFACFKKIIQPSGCDRVNLGLRCTGSGMGFIAVGLSIILFTADQFEEALLREYEPECYNLVPTARSDGQKSIGPALNSLLPEGNMNTMVSKIFAFGTIMLAICLGQPLLQAADRFDPPALYLTWQNDPTTTMVVHWQTEEKSDPRVYYRVRGASNEWLKADGQSTLLPSSDRTIHRVELTGLKPDLSYAFCFKPGEREFFFRTAPATLQRPIRFVAGGDIYHDREPTDIMNELAGKLDPLFVVWGGDLAYSCEKAIKPEKMERWYAFWDSWKQKARTPDGRLIPLLVTIGNHEVHGSWKQPPEMAAAYYAQFPTPDNRGYQAITFGKYLSVLLLDSGITQPIDGPQLAWLNDTLRSSRRIKHVFPVYHIPAYPSVRSESEGVNGELTQQVRSLWCPLFEKAGVKFAFENHDHAYKRTHPIRNGKLDPKGIVYLGDGAWGVKVRKPKEDRWYLEKADAIRHLFLVTISNEGQHIVSVNDKGEFFDEIYRPITGR